MHGKKRRRIILAMAVVFFPLICAVVLLNAALTRYVGSDGFRGAMNMETAKGLHLGGGSYEPIHRTGLFTASSGGFEGVEGRKAIVSMTARKITAKFNPWGVFRRRWQLDDVRIESGEVEIHTYEPAPEPAPVKPWYAVFLPDRVYLKQVVCDTADVTWRLRGQKSGFFGARLLITPHGRDFEYRASGGIMKMPLAPDLELRGVHLLVTKELLSLYDLELAPEQNGDGIIHVKGTAGLAEDKSVDADMMFSGISITRWLPESWSGHFSGIASGAVHWSGKNTQLENSSGRVALRIQDGRLSDLPLLQKLVSITGEKSFETLEPEECSLKVEWRYPRVEFKDIVIGERGKFRVEGAFSIDNRALAGAVRLGVAPEYLAWLPDARDVFTPGEGGYSWATIHLSGTIEHPEQDLSSRVTTMLEDHPGALLEYFFREAGRRFETFFNNQ